MNDAKLFFSTDQAITTDAVSEFYLDCNSITEIGRGTVLYVVLYVTTVFDTAAGDGFDVELCTKADGAPTASEMIANLGNIGTAAGEAGKSTGLKMKFPLPAVGLLRYIGLNYNVETGPLATGTVTALLTLI